MIHSSIFKSDATFQFTEIGYFWRERALLTSKSHIIDFMTPIYMHLGLQFEGIELYQMNDDESTAIKEGIPYPLDSGGFKVYGITSGERKYFIVAVEISIKCIDEGK